jgi:hypothetical protein
MSDIIDLTRVSADFQITFDQLDLVLMITTGGIGYLARQAYNHFEGKAARDTELQRKNFQRLIDEAQRRGARRMVFRTSPDLAIFAPLGGDIKYLRRENDYDLVEVSFA